MRVQRVVTVGCPVAVPVPALVQGQDPVTVAQREGGEVPRVGGLGHAVQHEDGLRIRGAPVEVVEVHALEPNDPVGWSGLVPELDARGPRRLVQ